MQYSISWVGQIPPKKLVEHDEITVRGIYVIVIPKNKKLIE